MPTTAKVIKMTKEQKSVIAGSIVNLLNEQVKKKNKKLCEENMHEKQTPLHGFEMLLNLTIISDSELNEIAKCAGV